MKFSVLQLNPIVGDLAGNAEAIFQAVTQASQAQPAPDLCITSELCLTGYAPRDLLMQPTFVRNTWQVLNRLAERLNGLPAVLVGVPTDNSDRVGRPLFNSAALLQGGQVQEVFHKSLLPTYDVFDEDRYFQRADVPHVLSINGVRIGITICEDIWNDADFWLKRGSRLRYHRDPIAHLVANQVQVILNLSASPYELGKQHLRQAMLSSMASKYRVPIVYVNQVGANDDVIFDGASLAFSADGRLAGRGRAFATDRLDLSFTPASGELQGEIAPSPEEDSDPHSPPALWQALVLGVKDYFAKTGFKRAVLGLSGGIDSALVATLAADALGAQNVTGILMPSPYSSDHSIRDAEILAQNLGIATHTVAIGDLMRDFDTGLAPIFAGMPADVTEENIQARIRGTLLMAYSNKMGALLITTGNKSEMAVGYCTLYGDMCGAIAPIADVYKTMVYRLANWYNQQAEREVIPLNSIRKAPSAELRPGQTDQDSLPPYDLLDQILYLHIERFHAAPDLVEKGYDANTVQKVLRLVRISEFKRRQAAIVLKVSPRAFSTGWRVPIAQRAGW